MKNENPGALESGALSAGDYSAWLRQMRSSLAGNGGVDVACGECRACCSSSQFIHVRPTEARALSSIPRHLLVGAPGLPKGHRLIGYDRQGLCPMLKAGNCSIYQDRPQTCRDYDCRIFTAAGLEAGGPEKAGINRQVKRWRFSYPTPGDRQEHRAVEAAARFVRENADVFPGGRVPGDPGQLAVIALKAYEVFMDADDVASGSRSRADVAAAVMDACRTFDAGRGTSPR